MDGEDAPNCSDRSFFRNDFGPTGQTNHPTTDRSTEGGHLAQAKPERGEQQMWYAWVCVREREESRLRRRRQTLFSSSSLALWA
jgi:hypothetical protein